jgi:hypothetical protein
MEKFVEVLEEKSISTTEDHILSKGNNKHGIYQKILNSEEQNIGCNTVDFFQQIGIYLDMEVSDRFGYVVTTNTNDEVFVRATKEKYYTLLFGYMPDTKLQIVQTADDNTNVEEIEFTKGDLIILTDSIEYTYGSATYKENKIFEVIYMFFNTP